MLDNHKELLDTIETALAWLVAVAALAAWYAVYAS